MLRRRLLIAAASGAALLACALIGAALLLDTDAARRAIEQRVSDLAGAEVRYESLSARLLPSPRAELRGVSIHAADAIQGRIAAAEIRFAVLPLLAGNLRVSHVQITEPVLEVRVSPPAIVSEAFSTYRQTLGPMVAALARNAAGATFAISGGRIEVVSAG